MYDSWLTVLMSDNALIRLENLKALKLSAAELNLRVDGAKSYWHGMLAGDRPFGEKIARKIEEKLELPRGWLDEPKSEKPKPKEKAPDLLAPSAILSSLSVNAITLGAAFDRVHADIQDQLHMVLTDYIAQAQREWLQRGKRPEFHQSQTLAVEPQISTNFVNALSQRVGAGAARSKSHNQ